MPEGLLKEMNSLSKINFEKINKIFVIMPGGIGNLVLMLPALKALRKATQGKKITLMIAEPKVAEIIKGENLIDEVILHDRRVSQSLYKKCKFILEMREKKFDLAIVASHTNALRGSLLTLLMGIKHRVGQDIKGQGLFYTTKVPFSSNLHETDGSIRIMEAMGISMAEKIPSLSLEKEDQASAISFLNSQKIESGKYLIGMHIGSGYKQTFKRWPEERFANLADMINDKYQCNIIMTGGPQEATLVKETMTLSHSKIINASGKLTIGQTASLIEKCDLFISNDSGLAHIAAAVNTPLIVLFGLTNINRIAPKGAKVFLIKKDVNAHCSENEKHNPLLLITEKEVFNKVNEVLYL